MGSHTLLPNPRPTKKVVQGDPQVCWEMTGMALVGWVGLRPDQAGVLLPLLGSVWLMLIYPLG